MNEQNRKDSILKQYVLGTAGLGGVWGNPDPEASVNTIVRALEAGMVSIDTAPAYGDGEILVGKALQQWQGPRPQISTKVGRLKSYTSDQGMYDYTPGGMNKSVENSLKVLGLPYIDILFLHEPAAIPEAEIAPAVKQMIAFKQNGYAAKIGLGGNYPHSFVHYLDAGIFDVVMEYNRLNACCVDALDTSLPECRNRNISYWAASPLHMGLLGSKFRDFVVSRPAWLEPRFIGAALGIHRLAEENGLTLPFMALRFLQNIPFPLNIVIGPATQREFSDCVSAILQGPLEDSLYNKIVYYIKNQLNK